MPYIGNQHNVGDHVNNFKVLDDISSYTATFNGSATSVVSTSNDTIRIPVHRFIQGQRVTYNNGGGSNIGGLTSGTAYYVSFDSSNTIKLATSLSNANSNTVINLSSVGGGTSHTLNAAFDGINTKFKVTYASGKAARFNNATQLNVAINNVIQRPNLSAASFTEGFAIEDSHKIVFKDAPTASDIFWGSIIANTIENFDLRDNEIDNFTGNGSTTEFTLSTVPANNESVIVTIDGVLQHPSDSATTRAYTLIDSIIQFSSAPALNAEIQVRHIGFAGATTNDVSGFYGRTGNVALTANDHITTGDLTSRNINISGILTASSASFGGDVSIGGTLTYEDVTNIDSVGIITAQKDIHVGAGLSVVGVTTTGQINANGSITATRLTVSSASQVVTVGAGGSVGIGTDDPDAPLQVYGDIKITNDTGGSIQSNGLRTTPDGKFQLLRNNPTNDQAVITIDDDNGGRVGIGTTIPTQILHILDASPIIQFTDTNGLGSRINADSGNLYFDTHNNNRDIIFRGGNSSTNEVARITGDGLLGIGTPNPGIPFHVYHATTNELARFQSGDASCFITFGDSDSHATSTNRPLLGAKGNSMFFQTGGSERLRIDNGGRIGLGIANPDDYFSSYNRVVMGRTNDTGGMTIVSSTTSGGYISFADGTSGNQAYRGMIAYQHSGDYMTFGTDGGIEKMRITSGGDIGIGTNAPTTNLHISGTGQNGLRVDSNGQAISLHNHNEFYGYIGHQGGKLFINAGGTEDTLLLKTNGSERLRITSGGDVGIASAIPSARLDVFATGGTIAQFGDPRSASFECIRIKNDVASYPAITNDSTHDTLDLRSMGSVQVTLDANNNDTGNYFRVMANGAGGAGTERFRVTEEGNVGINTNDPKSRLDVRGDINYNNNAIISNFDSSGIGGGNIDHIWHGDASNYGRGGTWNFCSDTTYKAAGNSAIQIGYQANSGGGHFLSNVGIGTTNPQARLHISSGTSGDCELILEADTDNNNENDNPRIVFQQDGAIKQAAIEQLNNELTISNSVSSGGGIVFKTGSVTNYTNATEALRIHDNGNVMIGAGDPSTQLHVKNGSSVVRVESTSTSTSARVEITGASDSYSGLHFGDTSDVDNGFIRYYNADNYFLIGTATAERVRIYSDGRVNIGGTNEVQLESGSENILYLHGAIVGANVDFAYGQRILLDDDDTGTATADRERGCLYAQFNGNCSGGDTNDETRAWNIYSDLNINADYDNAYGVYADVKSNFTSGTISVMRGVYGLCQTQNSGQITEMVGAYGLSQTTTGANSLTINDLVGVKGRANMCAGSSTANVTDLVGVWGNIDNDNNTAQATGGKCALFYGNYDKTTGLHNPQGIRIDTSVPNYFRGAIAINGGGNFLPTGNNAIHIKNNTNATGIFLEQTGDQYNVIKGSANRSGQDNAIIDIQGYWNTTQVGRIRIDTGADTTNKDDGRIQFFTASGGSLSEVMQIQENGEIAMDSSGTTSDALANLHVQNETFRVSNRTQTSSYIHLRAWESGDDGDRATFMQMANNVPKFNVTNRGQVFGASHHYAGRARTDANAPTNYYAHGAHGFYAYSGRTDDDSASRSYVYIRAWDQGDHGDRSIIQYADSGSDTESVNSTGDIRFVVKADGRVQGKGGSFYAGRVEHDNANPSDYFQTGERGFQAYGNDETDETYIYGRNVADNSNVFFSEVNGEANVKIEADGGTATDGTWSDANADYAEMFEWADGNTSNEERRGMTVVLDGEKIKLATDSDNKDNIIGVVSANPVIVGDSAPLGWHGRYKKDVFGSPVKKAHEFLVWNRGYREVDGVSVLFKQPDPNDPKSLNKCERCPVEEIDERKAKGEIPDYAIKNNIRITTYAKEVDTETYDSTKKYIRRQDRKEWDAIGLVGKLIVKRGQPIGSRWILMKSNIGTDPNDSSIILDKYLVR